MAAASDLPRSKGVPAAIFKSSRQSGVAKLAGRSLDTFPPELCDPFAFLEDGEKGWTITLPVRIELADNDIETLPESLNADNAAFSSLKQLDLRNNALASLHDGFWTLPALATLGLSGNPLVSVSGGIAGLANTLTDLDLSYTKLKALPETLGSLSELVKLKVAHSDNLASLPASIGSLSKLQHLAASHCKLTEVPEGLGQCTALKTLDLSFNKLAGALPANLSNLSALESYNVASNRITTVPPMPTSSALRSVFWGHNRLIKLDASALLNAPNMTELLLNNNLIDDVPLEVGALLKLKLIDVGCNNLQSMPTGLGYLPDLTRIVYAGNPCEVRLGTRSSEDLKRFMRTRGPPHPALKEAGIEVEDESDASGKLMAKAKKLLASGNEAEGVEAMAAAEQLLQQEDDSSSEKQALSLAVAQAAASRVFDCSSKALKVLPGAAMASVGPVLQTVDVSKNALTNLLGQAPPSASSSEDGSDNWLSACSALKTLDASSNKLSAPLPFSLRTSPIATLKLDHNALTVASLAEVFGDTKSNSSRAAAAAESDYDPRLSFSPLGKSCTHLDLSTNRLNSIPSGVLDLRSLVHLNLAANALGASAAEAVPWPRLGACTSLDLSNNKIESLGSVPWMPQLQELRVCHNEIRRFPEELGANETLKSILLEGNPQRIINSEIVSNGGAAVKAWFKRRLKDGYERPHHPHEQLAADDPPPPPPAPPSRRPKSEIEMELTSLMREVTRIAKDLDENSTSMSSTSKVSAKKEMASKKSAAAKLKAELTTYP